ncbi:MAG: cell division protein SepF [Bacillota bacterium]|jgi:cell division inhibitor SepF
MKVWSKLLDFLGFEEADEEELAEEEDEVEEVPAPRFRPNVVELKSAKNMKLVVFGPKSYDDVQAIADHLRAQRTVVVNLEGAEPRVRVRVLDFLNGAVYALGGRSQQISSFIFVLAPTNVDISNLMDEDWTQQEGSVATHRTGGA